MDLYALPPEEFTAAREAAAKDDKSLKVLRRPTASAWVVNILVRRDSRLLDELVALGTSLAEAQQNGSGEALRQLGEQRGQLVGAVTQRAVDLVGRDVRATVRDEVTATLEAALADPASAAAVRTGQLVRPLSFAGFGGVDLEGAVATRTKPPHGRPDTTQARDALRAAEQEQAAARRRRTGVEREREALVRKATAATKAVATAQTGPDAARHALDRLRRAP